MGAHHAVHHGQAQSGALADGLGGEERLEDAQLRGGIDAGAVVHHADGHVLAGRQCEALAQAVVGLHGRRLHAHRAARIAKGMDGIRAQVQQGLLHLGGIGQQGGQIAVQVQAQLDGRRQGHAQQALGVVDGLGHRHGGAPGRLVAAEGEDLPDEVARAPAGLLDLPQALQHR